jgi:hypothetical protein
MSARYCSAHTQAFPPSSSNAVPTRTCSLDRTQQRPADAGSSARRLTIGRIPDRPGAADRVASILDPAAVLPRSSVAGLARSGYGPARTDHQAWSAPQRRTRIPHRNRVKFKIWLWIYKSGCRKVGRFSVSVSPATERSPWPPLRRGSARSCATTPSSYGSLPTPCPTGWARTIFFNCRVGWALLPTKWSPREPSHPLSLKQTRGSLT